MSPGRADEKTKKGASLKSCVGLALLAFTLTSGTTPADAIAGCPSSRPTAIQGSIVAFGGQFDRWSVNALVGVDLRNANGQKLNVDGSIRPQSTYSATDRINPSLPAPGAPLGYERTWGSGNDTGPLCVSTRVRSAFIEVYPKNTNGNTDSDHFGLASAHGMAIAPNQVNDIGLRLPTSYTYGGNTGDYNGFITYRGQAIPTGDLNIRTWPTDSGSACGVQGLATIFHRAG